MPARREDLISAMNLLHVWMAGHFDLIRLLTIDYIRRDSSNEMDRGAWLRRYCKTDLLLKPAPRLQRFYWHADVWPTVTAPATEPRSNLHCT